MPGERSKSSKSLKADSGVEDMFHFLNSPIPRLVPSGSSSPSPCSSMSSRPMHSSSLDVMMQMDSPSLDYGKVRSAEGTEGSGK